MKTIAEALRDVGACFGPLGAVQKPLLSALDHVLADDVVARADLPAFDNSAMDGYAVRHADLSEAPCKLAVCGESRAGGPAPPELGPRTAHRVFTGALVAGGADTVVIQENTESDPDAGTVTVLRIPERGANVRTRGSDLRRGAQALPRGALLGPGEIGLLASQGLSSATVHRAPTVAIVTTGDELREIGQADEPGTIVNSNAYALAAQVARAGGVPWTLPIAPDSLEEIERQLRDAMRADVVLSVGGVSVGDYDLVARALRQIGARQIFWKVAIKPGKPLWFGAAGTTPVFGLPGNPVSAMITFEIFVRPGLLRMRGLTTPYPRPVEVELAEDYRHSTGRTELVRATLEYRGGRTTAHLHPLQGSGALPSMCGVDALVVLSASTERFAAGTPLPAIPLASWQGSADHPF